MDHDRYGLDGLPISCRDANCDPVTGIAFPRFQKVDSDGIPFLRASLATMMVLFLAFFVWQSQLLG